MRIPNAEQAMIAEEKIVQYLLNPEHVDGASKARVLARAGFHADHPQELDRALRVRHLILEAEIGKPSPFGIKYEITGRLTGPIGSVLVKSIWMIRFDESFPRLITLVPENLR
ncbi:MAG: hypothetical protein IT426_17550 [Pirellulales bacterium]|nr:hypothetical protein [Pirellulales bacterium]